MRGKTFAFLGCPALYVPTSQQPRLKKYGTCFREKQRSEKSKFQTMRELHQ
jgi:hypothetical protein